MNTMVRLTFSLLAILYAFGIVTGSAQGKDEHPSPHFSGTELPEPPSQKRAWTPAKTKLPSALISAVKALFDAGLADPRECEYRAIKISVGSCWSGDAGVGKTNGWVLPAPEGTKQRFAVCWNGLVYPVVALGDRADLKADARTMIKNDDDMRANRGKSFYRFRHAWSEWESASHHRLLPLKVCLLLRLGEEELARDAWAAWTAGMKENRNDDSMHLRDPYLLLATDWVWARFDRALGAHMRGDDRLALLDARALLLMEKAVEAEAKRLKFPRRTDHNDRLLPYIDFLEPLPGLAADQERRALAPKKAGKVDDPDKARRIAALVHDLENVSARQWGQPGGVQLNRDKTIKALIAEGHEAVEPLLRCLEDDKRLTRSVGFSRDFHYDRSIIRVDRAAFEALSEILQTSSFGKDGPRAYWERFKNVPKEERWFLILADDKMTTEQWLEAAGEIARLATGSVPDHKGGNESPPLSVALRKKKSPSVSELMLKRIEALRQMGEPGSRRMWRIMDACTMARHLAKWDAQAALPALNLLSAQCRELVVGDSYRGLAQSLAQVAETRVEAGDAKALDDYGAWIRTATTEQVERSWRYVLQPMWRNPDHPVVVAAAAAMFNNEQSPWNKRFLRDYATHELMETPMLGVAAFRERLLVELTNRQPAGKVKLGQEGSVSVEVTDGYSGGRGGNSSDDPLAPKPGTETEFRVCDFYAWSLSYVGGMPRCELYWPVAERDQAVRACVAALAKYGERFKYAPNVRDPFEHFGRDIAFMNFPHLERPATAQDMDQGRAVFSLAPAEKVRVWNLPACPLKARWVEAADKKRDGDARAERGRDGLVWQAEELFMNGKWQRFYGFVGAYRVAKLSAEQIEFPTEEWGWGELGSGIDCKLTGPYTGKKRNDADVETPLHVGDSSIVCVQLRNRSGLERRLPAEFVRQDPQRGPCLHQGMELRLKYAPAEPGSWAIDKTANEEKAWRELTLKTNAHFTSQLTEKAALPGQVFAEFNLNLSDWFDVSQAGHYQFDIIFHNKDGGIAEGTSWKVEFFLGPPRK